MGEKDQQQEVEMEALEAEISDLEERLSDESEDDTVAAPKAKSAKKFSFRELAFSVISKLKWSPQAKPTLNADEILRLPLVEKVSVTHDTRLLRFALPSAEHVLGLPVGNYILLQAWVGGELLVRPYTPISDSTGGLVELLVKVYPEGKMSKFLDSLQIGESVEARGPFGHIEYAGRGRFLVDGEERVYSQVGLICGGSGLTPAYRVVRAALADPADKTEFRLLYANRTPQDILLRGELDAWAREYPGRFKVQYTVDRPGPPPAAAAAVDPETAAEWGGEVGYVTPAMVRALVPPPGPAAAVFMCGPPVMVYMWARPAVLLAGYPHRHCLEF